MKSFLRNHPFYVLALGAALAAIGTVGQFNDPTNLYHVLGFASLPVFGLFVYGLFLQNEKPA